jgi:hypothetical protein
LAAAAGRAKITVANMSLVERAWRFALQTFAIW